MTVTASNPPKLLPTREAAVRLGVTQKTIRDWIAAGVLPAVRVGDYGHLRISTEAIALGPGAG